MMHVIPLITRIVPGLYHPPEVDNVDTVPGSYISCQICQTTISIKSLKARVVKCPRCQEGNVSQQVLKLENKPNEYS